MVIATIAFTSCSKKEVVKDSQPADVITMTDQESSLKGIRVYQQVVDLTGEYPPVAFMTKNEISLVSLAMFRDLSNLEQGSLFLPTVNDNLQGNASLLASSPEGLFLPAYWTIEQSKNPNTDEWTLSVGVVGFGESKNILPKDPVLVKGAKHEIDLITNLLNNGLVLYVGEGHPGFG